LPELWQTEHLPTPLSPFELLTLTGYFTSAQGMASRSPCTEAACTAWTRLESGSAWLPDWSWQLTHWSVSNLTPWRASWNGARPSLWQRTQSPEIFLSAVAVPTWMVRKALESVP
jgi:hypothetical protein